MGGGYAGIRAHDCWGGVEAGVGVVAGGVEAGEGVVGGAEGRQRARHECAHPMG